MLLAPLCNAAAIVEVALNTSIITTMNYGAINIDPETMGGTPVFTGTRVPVQALFDYIETGETLDEFLENFPSVKKNIAIQVLQMAEKTITTEKILNENFA